jgi:predicted phosphodiesterase
MLKTGLSMIAIISDIHGNHPALAAVLAELDRLGASRIVCLGDIAGYYCQVNECCETLIRRNVFSLMGNHDWYLAFNEGCARSRSANECLDYQRRVLAPSNLAWLASLKPQAVVERLSIVHGGWNDPVDEYVVPSTEYFSAIEGSFFASGHTHVPCVWTNGVKTYCNPGSVGQPRDGDPRASFAICDDYEFSIHRVPYDLGEIQQAMKDAGFDEYFYRNLEVGARIGGRIDRLEKRG